MSRGATGPSEVPLGPPATATTSSRSDRMADGNRVSQALARGYGNQGPPSAPNPFSAAPRFAPPSLPTSQEGEPAQKRAVARPKKGTGPAAARARPSPPTNGDSSPSRSQPVASSSRSQAAGPQNGPPATPPAKRQPAPSSSSRTPAIPVRRGTPSRAAAASGSASKRRRQEDDDEEDPIEDDELDELDDDDDEDDFQDEQPHDTSNPFSGSNPLASYRSSQCQTVVLLGWLRDKTLNLDAEYQRDVVWPGTNQSALIDSLFRNYPVPPILCAYEMDDIGRETRRCIDGKQRLTSIRRFMDGEIPWTPLEGKNVGQKYWYRMPMKTYNKKDHPLSAELKKVFERKTLIVEDFSDLPDEKEREIFQRIQNGKPLRPAEKLRAFNTTTVHFVEEMLRTHVTNPGGLDTHFDHWDHKRARAFQNMASLIYVVEAYPEQRTITTSNLDAWLHKDLPIEASLKQKIDKVFETYITIFKRYQAFAIGKWETKVLAPLEWIFLGLVIYEYHDRECTDRQIAELIGQMRDYLRAKHADVRVNSNCTATAYKWLKAQPKPPKVDIVLSDPEDIQDNHGRNKRRRLVYEDDDGDFVPQ